MKIYVAHLSSPRILPFIGVDWEDNRYLKWGRLIITFWKRYKLTALRQRVVCFIKGHDFQDEVGCARCGKLL
jgi:hypothetical protein